MSDAGNAVLAHVAFTFVLAAKAKNGAKAKRDAIRCSEEDPASETDNGCPPCWASGAEPDDYCDNCKERDRVHREEVLPASKKRTAALRKLMTFGPKKYSYPK